MEAGAVVVSRSLSSAECNPVEAIRGWVACERTVASMSPLSTLLLLSLLALHSSGHVLSQGLPRTDGLGLLKRSPEAAPDASAGLPDGLDLSVSIPFDMLRRRYIQAIHRGQARSQVRDLKYGKFCNHLCFFVCYLAINNQKLRHPLPKNEDSFKQKMKMTS